MKLFAAILAVLLACAPAVAQNIANLPTAAPLTGSELLVGLQGSGCPNRTAPCATIAATPAQIGTYLGATFQPLDGDLTSLAAQTAVNSLIYRQSANTWAPVTLGPNFAFSGGSLTIPGLPITLSGDAAGATSSTSGALALTLASVNTSPGTCGSSGSLTVPLPVIDPKGRVTSCSTYALGSAASYSVGTSGGVVGLLNGNNTYGGNVTFSNVVTGSINGNAATATKLTATLGIAAGGTGATSASSALAALGGAPLTAPVFVAPINVYPTSLPNSVAAANQIGIGENTQTSGYKFNLGYYRNSTSGTWTGVIDTLAGGSPSLLQINPSGGPVQFGGTTQITSASTVANLPTCNAAARGTRSVVTDATSPTFLATLNGGGSVVAPAFCNGSAWVAD